MKVFAFPNANCSTISVTSSAQTLESLINTAGGVTVNFPNGYTAADLIVENGDIRVLYDGNVPTASKGLLFKQGSIQRIRGVAIENIQLISVSGSAVSVDVTIGRPGAFDEATSGAGAGGTSGASTTDESTFTAGSTAGTLAMGVYESSADTLTSGQAAVVGVDVNRNLKVTLATLLAGEDLTNNLLGVLTKPLPISTYSPSVYAPMTQVTKANIKAAPGNVLSAYISNANAALRYFQLHNTASAPSGGAVPLISLPVPAGTSTFPGNLILDNGFFSQAGLNFSTGLSWAISTTYATFTDSATAADHVPLITYV